MTVWRATVQSPWVLALGIAVSAAIVGYIAWAQAGPRTVYIDAAPVRIDPSAGPCHAITWKRVCEDWMAAGWPACTVGPGGAPVVELTPALASMAPRDHLLGAVVEIDGVRSVAIAPDACATPAPWHEVGHLYGLGHGGAAGDVMASPASRAGHRIPLYGGAL